MYDFQGLADLYLKNWQAWLPKWLPGGKMEGREYVCAGIRGGQGTSFKVNTVTGVFADFAIAGDKGKDLIALWALQNNLSQGEAAKQLAAQSHYDLDTSQDTPPLADVPAAKQAELPPLDAPSPDFKNASRTWAYNDATGRLMFYVARYETDGGKEFSPFTWVDGGWKRKSWPSPRPLYGLDRLALAPNKPVVVCEGEKAADAATAIMGGYVAIAWPNGALAVEKTDWTPLKGRKVLLWPDADEPGLKAMVKLAQLLKPIATEIKILDVSGQKDKWDAADAVEEKWEYKDLIGWCKAGPDGKSRAVLVWPLPDRPPLEQVIQEARRDGEVIPVVEAVSTAMPQSDLALQKLKWADDRGQIHSNMETVLRAFEGMPMFKDVSGQGKIWWDEFLKRPRTSMWCRNGATERDWEDHDDLNLLRVFQNQLELPKTKKANIQDAIMYIAHNNPRNEIKEWLEALEWDGVKRLSTFCEKYLAVAPSKFASATGKNFLVSLVARIYKPGCKVDTMPVLEGEEGKRKSTAFEILGGKWYCDCRVDVNQKKEFEETIQGKWLIEIAELDSFRKAENDTLKAILSSRTDRYRASYGRLAADYLRQCVFAGTTNGHDYLPPGKARRWYPWEGTGERADYHQLQIDRDQLFAQAVHLYKSQIGQPDEPEIPGHWWYVPEKEAAEIREARQKEDSWTEPVRIWLTQNFMEKFKLNTCAKDALGIDPIKLGIGDSRRLGHVLRGLKWENITIREKVSGGNDITGKWWVKKDTFDDPPVDDTPPF